MKYAEHYARAQAVEIAVKACAADGTSHSLISKAQEIFDFIGVPEDPETSQTAPCGSLGEQPDF